jgi:hypothetical protein
MRVELRPTVPEDLPFCIAETLPYRIKCITALVPGSSPGTFEVIGLGGLGYRPDGTVVAFAQILPALRKYPAAIHRGGLKVMAMIRASHVPMVIAEAQEGVPQARRWLERLGFEHVEISGREAFVWRRNGRCGMNATPPQG